MIIMGRGERGAAFWRKGECRDVMQRHDMTCFPILNAVPTCEVPGASVDSSFMTALK